MFELNGIWYESAEALASAYPAIPIDHASVYGDIPLACFEQACLLPQDAAAQFLRRTSKRQYEMLAQKVNNCDFGKVLTLKEGQIVWAGPLSLHASRKIPQDSELFATRGYKYWHWRGFPEDSRKAHGCLVCEKATASRCGACGVAMYCSNQCLKAHRPEHRNACRAAVKIMHGGEL